MANPLRAFAAQYFTLPASWKALGITLGVLFVDSYYLDSCVKYNIFGADGKGGFMLQMLTRVDHHEEEFREERKKWYWHQRKAKFYMPQDYTFNDRLDYKTVSYGAAHGNSYLNPKDLPGNHDANAYFFNELEYSDLYKK
jgi:hypothetical protein